VKDLYDFYEQSVKVGVGFLCCVLVWLFGFFKF
jgi:hypothetical protein